MNSSADSLFCKALLSGLARMSDVSGDGWLAAICVEALSLSAEYVNPGIIERINKLSAKINISLDAVMIANLIIF